MRTLASVTRPADPGASFHYRVTIVTGAAGGYRLEVEPSGDALASWCPRPQMARSLSSLHEWVDEMLDHEAEQRSVPSEQKACVAGALREALAIARRADEEPPGTLFNKDRTTCTQGHPLQPVLHDNMPCPWPGCAEMGSRRRLPTRTWKVPVRVQGRPRSSFVKPVYEIYIAEHDHEAWAWRHVDTREA